VEQCFLHNYQYDSVKFLLPTFFFFLDIALKYIKYNFFFFITLIIYINFF